MSFPGIYLLKNMAFLMQKLLLVCVLLIFFTYADKIRLILIKSFCKYVSVEIKYLTNSEANTILHTEGGNRFLPIEDIKVCHSISSARMTSAEETETFPHKWRSRWRKSACPFQGKEAANTP